MTHLLQIQLLIWTLLFLIVSSSSALARDFDVAPNPMNDGWPVAKPSTAGLDPRDLKELTELIKAGTTMPHIHAILVEHQGSLVFERYWPGEDYSIKGPQGYVNHGPKTLHDLRSITKSVTSILVGIALGDEAEMQLMRPVTSFYPAQTQFGEGLSSVNLHHVLTMTAGLDWNEMYVSYFNDRNDEIRSIAATDPIGFVLERDVTQTPGKTWAYNGGLTNIAADIVQRQTNMPLIAFAKANLFDPMDIDDFEWVRPKAWADGNIPSASAGLRLRARDLAKIGSLVLHGGKWQGQQIVPSDWIETSTKRHVRDNPWGPPGAYGYGYFWFPGTHLSGQEVIRAVGYGGQRLYVLPQSGLSITIFAGDFENPDGQAGARILGRIIRALD